MFTWIKIIRKLSQQENILDLLDNKIQESSQLLEALNAAISKANSQIQEIDAKITESQEKFTNMKESSRKEVKSLAETLQKEINDFEGLVNSSKAEFAQLSGHLGTYAKNVHQHLEDIKKAAQDHCAAFNQEVKVYEGNVSKLGDKLTELENAIAEFQR
ncbi:MAG: hypothetical protein GX902_11800 [Lentisphaerae bacterium]|nr:hypothetical protein [Lentisphaerota bacterium]